MLRSVYLYRGLFALETAAKYLPDSLNEVVGAERLADKVCSRPLFLGTAAHSGKHENRDGFGGVFRPKGAENPFAVHLRHHLIQENHIWELLTGYA